MDRTVGFPTCILYFLRLNVQAWILLCIWKVHLYPGVHADDPHVLYQYGRIPMEGMVKAFRHHELIRPKVFQDGRLLTETLAQNGHVKDLTVTFRAFNRGFVLDLHLNPILFSATYVEKAVHVNPRTGMKRLPVNHTESHCFYQGHLRGQSASAAAISTCCGIRGQISVKDESYIIEPDGDHGNLTGVHLIFKQSDYAHQNLSCGQSSHPRSKRDRSKSKLNRPTKIMEPRDADQSTRYVELYIVSDYSQYRQLNSDLGKVIQRTKDIINIVGSIYLPLNIYIVLVGIEVWTERNFIQVNGNSDSAMNQFLGYRRTFINPFHRNDNAQLIIADELGGGIVGKAPIMTFCTYQTSGGVNSDRHTSLGAIATTVAHEMGHNFGLYHDLDSCDCPDSRCVMSSGGGSGNPTRWSSCSRQMLADNFHQGMDYCLKDLPPTTYVGSTCGNGLTEDGEECDCGLEQDCKNPCCIASTCRLAMNATCATGRCCDLTTCQPLPAATECRPSHGNCDLPEYCGGVSENCPDNIYMADGTPCLIGGVGSYCYHGRCSTHDSQCRLLWGRTGRMSHRLCYDQFNVMGSGHGHCGYDWIYENFTKCQRKDVLCGMLHCEHQGEKLMFWKEALVLTMPDTYIITSGQRYDCKAAIMDVGLDTPDAGMTFDGTKCGENQICVSHQCVSLDSLHIKPCENCNGHGDCNSLGQCHCHLGFAPPYCNTRGHGGSIHSGPARQHPSSNIGLVIGLSFLFVAMVPLVVILGFLVYRHNDKIKSFVVQRCSQLGSRTFCEKETFQKDTKCIEMSPPEVTVANPAAPPLAKITGVRRATSFRPEDISNPHLQSSTNSTLNLPPSSRSPVALTYANSCRATLPSDRTWLPATVEQGNESFVQSSHSVSSQFSDFSSSSSAAAESHLLLPKHGGDGEKESCGRLQPSREAPAPPRPESSFPPYACPKSKKETNRDPASMQLLQSCEGSRNRNLENSTKPELDKLKKNCQVSRQVGWTPGSQKEGNDASSRQQTPEKKSSDVGSEGFKRSDDKVKENKGKGVPTSTVSQLKNTFENTKDRTSGSVNFCDKATSVSVPKDSSSPIRQETTSASVPKNSSPSRQATIGKTEVGTNASKVTARSELSTRQAVPLKRTACGKNETRTDGSRVSSAIAKFQSSAPDSNTSPSGRTVRPSMAPKPPSVGKNDRT